MTPTPELRELLRAGAEAQPAPSPAGRAQVAQRARRYRSRRRFVGATVGLVLAAGLAAGLTVAHTGTGHPQRVTVSAPTVTGTVAGSSASRPGWKTVVYGGLEVSVPAAWTVKAPETNAPCVVPPARTVQPLAVTTSGVASCPNISVPEADASSVVIRCLYGPAKSLVPAMTRTTVVANAVLDVSQVDPGIYSVAYHQGATISEVDVNLPLERSTGKEILASIRPSASRC